MTCSLKAILARFKGNTAQAIKYCRGIIKQHPRLRAEYRAYILALRCIQVLGK
jgi:hypothetical protein